MDTLILSPPIPLSLYILPYWSNLSFLICDIRALWRSAPKRRMSKIKNSGLDQYGAEPSEQQQFGTAGVEGVKCSLKSQLMDEERIRSNEWLILADIRKDT